MLLIKSLRDVVDEHTTLNKFLCLFTLNAVLLDLLRSLLLC